MLQIEYPFTLPKGYQDKEGNLHREGVMRLAAAIDEIEGMRDPRVRENPAYLPVILLSRVVVRLGGLETVSAEVIEKLFTADFQYLSDLYEAINRPEPMEISCTCPHCGTSFRQTVNFTERA